MGSIPVEVFFGLTLLKNCFISAMNDMFCQLNVLLGIAFIILLDTVSRRMMMVKWFMHGSLAPGCCT